MMKEEKQKEKELLLNVLKDGLPYGLQLQITDVDGFTFSGELRVLSKNWCRLNITNPAKKARVKNETIPLNYIYIKPYLRSMSSMTDEEFQELHNICPHSTFNKTNISTWVVGLDGSEYGRITHLDEICIFINWLNAHHFDFHNLIERGLAIEVTEENNPYKE